LKALKLRNCVSLLDAVIDISVFCHSRVPAAMTLKNTVVNAIRMKTELRCVNPNSKLQ